MRASASLAHAQGAHESVLELLARLHEFLIQHEKDSISLAEAAADVQLARGRCKGRRVNRAILQRCLRMMRRDGRREIVAAAALTLSASLRPRKRLRVKSHPEDVEHRKRHPRSAPAGEKKRALRHALSRPCVSATHRKAARACRRPPCGSSVCRRLSVANMVVGVKVSLQGLLQVMP